MDLALPYNMDFHQTVQINTGSQPWMASPHAGVERIPLAREDAENGHATSIVRYLPGASFHSHNHPGGEEILVLDGMFSDETGDFPAGAYFRNPIGFHHAPFSASGCTLLVKLHQFQPDDDKRLHIDTTSANWQTLPVGVKKQVLHQHKRESVCLFDVPAGQTLPVSTGEGGEEIFVLCGALTAGERHLTKGSWLRSANTGTRWTAINKTRLWVKSGHLPTLHR